jgi:hypothetical protein
MADEVVESEEQTDAPVAEESGAEPTPAPSATDEYVQIRKDEWGTVVGALRDVYSRLPQQEQEEVEEFDPEDAPLEDIIKHYVDNEFSQFRPVIEAQQEKQGQEYMNHIFDTVEKDPSVGKFDREVAADFAMAAFQKYGGTADVAQQAAVMGARQAAELQKRFGSQAVKEYQDSLKKSPMDDPSFGGSGVRPGRKFESMDDVIAAYTGDEEV